MKTCNKCKEEKPLTEFYKKSVNRDGLNSQCKNCVSIYNKSYRNSNQETIKKLKSEWVKNNKNHVKDYFNDYYKRNKDKVSEYSKKWSNNNQKLVKKIQKKFRDKESRILSDSFIKGLIIKLIDNKKALITYKEIPNELVELKRIQIKIYREIYK